MRQLVNIARLTRRDYESWLQELLYFFIKTPGTCGLENCRPVGLLEVLFKCSEAFEAAAMVSVWKKMGTMSEEQWAFTEGKGCDGPLLMWMLMSEEAYLHKMDIAETEVDKKQAFDSPTPAAVCMVMRRQAMPEWKVRQYERRANSTLTRVISPFGLTESFIRLQGLTQGGTLSPILWNQLIAPCGRSCNAKGEVQFIYKAKREVNLRRSGGTKIWSEGTPCGRIYNAKREVQVKYKSKRDVNLTRSGGTKIWSEGTPCGRICNAKR